MERLERLQKANKARRAELDDLTAQVPLSPHQIFSQLVCSAHMLLQRSPKFADYSRHAPQPMVL